MNILTKIQNELKAPKNQFNSFGKYKYRNQEDILEAVKPLLLENDATLTLSDDIIEVGGSVFVKAIATFKAKDIDITTVALARHAVDKKGMDDSQITCTASSYARKYALNGLFLIDDTKDPDTDEYKKQLDARNKGAKQTPPTPPKEKIKILKDSKEYKKAIVYIKSELAKLTNPTKEQIEQKQQECIKITKKAYDILDPVVIDIIMEVNSQLNM